MENSFSVLLYFWCSTILLSTTILLIWIRHNNKSSKISHLQPPGSKGWPIIGNILDLGTIPHQSLHNLRSKYGPILFLKLGSINTIVIQSSNAAEQLFKHYDHIFCDRKCPNSLSALNYNQGSIAIGQYGSYLRFLRRLCSTKLLSNSRINNTIDLRQTCIDNMLENIEKESNAKVANGDLGEVNLAHILFLMSFNLVGNLVLSKDVLDLKSNEGKEFFDAMSNIAQWAGKSNLADCFPFLKWFDPQGIRRNMEIDMGTAMKIVAGYIEDRAKEKLLGKQRSRKDFLDVVLESDGDDQDGTVHKISEHNAHVLILEMFLAGSETSSTTIEWAMTELLRCQESMRKVKQELDQVVGANKNVEESNLDDLPYLQAIVKETLRLHPPLPLLLPRNALQETQFMGYLIPKDTQLFVNIWAIGRDPEIWEEPLSFKPERFIGSKIDYKGQNFELLSFGAGRRICVGLSLAQRIVHLALASLLYSFDWELGSNFTPEAIDMKERIGISVRKLVPLQLIPKKRFP